VSGPVLYDFDGLVTAPGLLARNPASCVDVINFRFPSPGVMRKRTGYVRQTGAVVVDRFFQALYTSAQLNDKFLALGVGLTSVPVVFYGDPASGWTALTDVSPFATIPGRGMAAIGNSHFINPTTIRRVEGSFSRMRCAGMPRGQLPWTYSMNAAVYSVLGGVGGIVPDGSNVAYRVTYCRKDDAGGIIEGPPTSRLVVRNINGTSGWGVGVARNVTLRIPLPNEVGSSTVKCGTDTFWRLYRSRISAVDTADDEMYLVNEAFFTAGDIAVGYAAVTDQTPDAFLYGGPTLHTNAVNFPEAGPAGPNGSINGQVLANEAPWIAQDIAEFAGCLFAAAPRAHPSFLMTLLSSGFAAGNTIVVAGVTLTAVAGAPAANQFTIVGGLASISLNIEATARNLVDAFNRAALAGSTPAQMHYISQGASLPGQILIEANDNGAFTVQSAAAGTLFRPDITTAQSATGFAQQTNVVAYSKPRRGDAFAPANSLTVGPGSATVWRIVAFRERLLCWTSEGLYQIDGTYEGGFTVSLVDSSLRLFEMFAVVVAEDRCLAWCFEGIAEVSDGGTRIVSEPIEPTLQAVARLRPAPSLLTGPVADDAFAVYDRVNHVVQFFYSAPGKVSAEPWCSDWLEWDTRERKWSIGNCAVTKFSDGVVQYSTGLVVLSLGVNSGGSPIGKTAAVFVQRNGGASTDYQDANDAGVSSAITSSATFQFQVPNSDARQHWQQLLLHFENGEFAYLSKPSSLFVRWETDVVISSELTLAPSSAIAKLETPRVTRRATRQRVRLRHTLAENLGLVVLNQSVAQTTARFPK
jgi:hypothetical protein